MHHLPSERDNDGGDDDGVAEDFAGGAGTDHVSRNTRGSRGIALT